MTPVTDAGVACFLIPTREEAEEIVEKIRRVEPELVCQLLRPDACQNEDAIRLIAAQTLSARASRSMLARRPEIDLLLRLAGTSQIKEAIDKAGYEGKGRTLVVMAGTPASLRRALARVKIQAGRLGSAPLSQREKMLVEGAALLGAERG